MFALATNTPIPGFQEEPACAQMCPNITTQQVRENNDLVEFIDRIYGFVACAGIGWLLSLIGVFTLIGGPTANNITTFAVLYVLGNITALCGTGFLLGPRSQCTKMWHPTRRYTTAFYLIMLIVVFSVALAKVNVGIVIAMMLIQVCAGIWYSASYIPFGRKIILTLLRQVPCFQPCFQAYDSYQASKGPSGSGDEENGQNSDIGKTIMNPMTSGFTKLSTMSSKM